MLIPLLIGMLWGNLDERFKQLCAAAAAGDHYVVRHRRQLQYQYGVHRRAVRDPVGIISALTGIVFYFIYNLF